MSNGQLTIDNIGLTIQNYMTQQQEIINHVLTNLDTLLKPLETFERLISHVNFDSESKTMINVDEHNELILLNTFNVNSGFFK